MSYYDGPRGRPELPWYDVMQVCRNGHKITDCLKQFPQHAKEHCPECGASTISKCEACHADIQGQYHVPDVFGFSDPQPPTHCAKCGQPFPWVKNNQRRNLSVRAQRAIQLIETQIQRLKNFPEATTEDAEFLRWRNSTMDLCDRFLPNSRHSQQIKSISFQDPVTRQVTDPDAKHKHLEAARARAHQSLEALIEEIETFDLPNEERAAHIPTTSGKSVLHQEFHGTTTINAMQVATDNATQSLSQTNEELAEHLRAIASLISESQELCRREIRECLVAIQAFSDEQAKAKHRRNSAKIVAAATTVLTLANRATDLTAKLAPHLPALSTLIENAKRLIP
jgi:hypothetical protein